MGQSYNPITGTIDTIRFGLDECKTKVDRLTIGRPPSDAYGASTLVFQVSCCIL